MFRMRRVSPAGLFVNECFGCRRPLRSAVGNDLVDLDCKAECSTIVRCGAEDALVCNGTCPAEQACMSVDDDGEGHDSDDGQMQGLTLSA